MALVSYSKGSKQKPDVKAFQQGMDKAQYAMSHATSGISYLTNVKTIKNNENNVHFPS